jgi:uncharacterized protein YfiM (DUF2279 family)
LDAEAIWLDFTSILDMDQCSGIVVDGGQVAKRKVGATLAFGILGAAGAKGSKHQSVLTARRKDGALAYFQIDKMSKQQVAARIAPVLHSAGVRLIDEFAISASTTNREASDDAANMAKAIRELADLRDEGLLTEEEFNTKKLELLSRM